MSFPQSFILQEGYSSTDEYSLCTDFSNCLDDFDLFKLRKEKEQLKKPAKKLTIDCILEEFRAREGVTTANPPFTEHRIILKKVLDNLPDALPKELKIEEPQIDGAKVDESKIENSTVGESKIKTPIAEESKLEELRLEETRLEEPNIDESKNEKPENEELKIEEQKLEELASGKPTIEESEIEDHKNEESKAVGLEFKNSRKAELHTLAPSLYFEKPKNLYEKAGGFADFISHRDDNLVITSLSSGILKKLELLQHRFMIFGIPYSDWTRASLVYVVDEALHMVMGKPEFDYHMPWGDLLMILTQCVSVMNEHLNLKSMTNDKNFKPHELAGPFIKRKLTMIKVSPPIIDKQVSLISLQAFIHRHIAALNNQDFVPSMANFEEIEDALSKLRIRLV